MPPTLAGHPASRPTRTIFPHQKRAVIEGTQHSDAVDGRASDHARAARASVHASGKRAGRPRYKPSERDRQQVKAMTAMGLGQSDICLVIGLSEKTLRRHFRAELNTGAAEANAKVAQSLFKQATGDKPNVIAAIFWLKARAGWRDQDPRDGTKGKKEIIDEASDRAMRGRFGAVQAPPKLRAVK